MEWSDRARWFGLPILFTKYWMNGEMLHRRKGFLWITEDRLPLYRVLDIRVKKSLFERMLGLGTIILYAADVTDSTFILKSVRKPDQVAELMQSKVNEIRKEYGVHGREMFGALAHEWTMQ